MGLLVSTTNNVRRAMLRTLLSDVTMTDNMKTYRQALRDLPASDDGKNATLKDGVLENVKWPQKPA